MWRDLKEYHLKTVEATCDKCGKKRVIREYNYNHNLALHDGKYLCQKCASAEQAKTDSFTFNIEYNFPDSEKKAKAIAKLKKRDIILLDYMKDERGLFPSRKYPKKVLKLKCKKCGCEWWGSPRIYLDKNGKCPVCVEIRIQKIIMRKKSDE